jgi:hypothetical protein
MGTTISYPGGDTEVLVAANLASLNELVAEIVDEMTVRGIGDREFADLVTRTLREHTWSLGFEFREQRAYSGQVSAPARFGRTYVAEVTGEDDAMLVERALDEARGFFGPAVMLAVPHTYTVSKAVPARKGPTGRHLYEADVKVKEVLSGDVA